MKIGIILAASFFTYGCATMDMVPHSADDVDFSGPEGKTGWSQYQHVEHFKGYSRRQIYDAAKVGLGNVGFSLRHADLSKGVVIGEHGVTLHDWNIITAVYFKGDHGAIDVKVIAEGSKDFGISGDVTSDGWTGKVLKEMRLYLNDQTQVTFKINKEDIESQF